MPNLSAYVLSSSALGYHKGRPKEPQCVPALVAEPKKKTAQLLCSFAPCLRAINHETACPIPCVHSRRLLLRRALGHSHRQRLLLSNLAPSTLLRPITPQPALPPYANRHTKLPTLLLNLNRILRP